MVDQPIHDRKGMWPVHTWLAFLSCWAPQYPHAILQPTNDRGCNTFEPSVSWWSFHPNQIKAERNVRHCISHPLAMTGLHCYWIHHILYLCLLWAGMKCCQNYIFCRPCTACWKMVNWVDLPIAINFFTLSGQIGDPRMLKYRVWGDPTLCGTFV